MSLTFTDIFCGAGGSSIGLTAAGMDLKLAANHWARAVETHATNFPDAEHLCADVNNYDMRRLPSTDVLWASPICTEISPAGGRRRRSAGLHSGQLDLLEHGSVDDAAWSRTRATAYDVLRAVEVHRYAAVLCENVIEFATDWPLFDWWTGAMGILGYRRQIVCVSSAHIAGPGNPAAPQWRDRLYIVFTRTDVPAPDVAPRPVAWCEPCGTDVAGIQSWRNPRRPQIGKYRRQYDYRCPNIACRNAIVEPYVRPAADVIDWTDLGPRISDRPRPLSANTTRRIEAGLARFARPFVATVAGNTYERPGSGYLRAWPAHGAPLNVRTCTNTDALVTPGMLVPSGGTWNDTATHTGQPMRTRTVRDMEALLTPPGAFYIKNYSGHHDQRAKPITDPFGTITTSDHHGLVVPYYTKGTAKPAGEPLGTVTTLDRFALATPASLDVADCRYRMLRPRESLRAQSFPDSYVVHGNQGEQTMQAGNAVSTNVARWLGDAVTAVLDGRHAKTGTA